MKSRVELEHVEILIDKARFVEMILDRKAEGILIVAINVDKDAYERARELGIDVVYGNIIG